jgi:ADP-ribosyl-[dinitrogen reductase] hydrolase
MKNRDIGCLLGLAVGDAVGTTVEFQQRGTFPKVTDMVGGGPFNLPAGKWTDDTSMALCLGESLLHRFNTEDQLKNYVKWWESGYLSSTDRCFDIGNTTKAALSHYLATGSPHSGQKDVWSSGNGALMRMAPLPIKYRNDGMYYNYVRESTKTTHATTQCIEASDLFAHILKDALNGVNIKNHFNYGDKYSHDEINNISTGSYMRKTYEEIKGYGYAVDTLECALWCFQNTYNFKDAILACVNVGDDADTTAAVCGQIAGAHYGVEGIPSEWLEKIYMREYITNLALKLGK